MGKGNSLVSWRTMVSCYRTMLIDTFDLRRIESNLIERKHELVQASSWFMNLVILVITIIGFGLFLYSQYNTKPEEVKEGLKVQVDTVDLANLNKVHAALQKSLAHEISFITLSEHGVYYATKSEQKLIPTHIRNISDVSGAGDTVIAVASLTYAATKDMSLAAEIANIAGGLVCELVGTAPIDKKQLQTEVVKLIGK